MNKLSIITEWTLRVIMQLNIFFMFGMLQSEQSIIILHCDLTFTLDNLTINCN